MQWEHNLTKLYQPWAYLKAAKINGAERYYFETSMLTARTKKIIEEIDWGEKWRQKGRLEGRKEGAN